MNFTTPYALCVINCDSWEDDILSLLEKFKNARFWDHPREKTVFVPLQSSVSNSSLKAVELNACVTWDGEKIRQIESGEEIGRTDMSNDKITQGQLCHGQGLL
jgi:hypothetical protein